MKSMRKYWPLLLLVALVAIGATPAFQDFCVTQFGISGNKVAIKSGALTTNFSARVLNSLAGFTNYGDVQLKSANGSSDILRVDGTEQEITFQQGLPFFSQATANRIAVFSGSKQLSSSIAVSDTEASYLAGVTSPIQAQLDGKPSNANLNNASNLFIKVNGGGGTNNTLTNMTLAGPLTAGVGGSAGSAGQLLTSTGTGTGWSNAPATGPTASNNIPSALSYSTTNVFINAGAGTAFRLTLTNNAGIQITNGSDGQAITLQLTQDTAGNRTVALTNLFNFGADITGVTLTTNAAKTDFIRAQYWAASNRWDVIGFVRGY